MPAFRQGCEIYGRQYGTGSSREPARDGPIFWGRVPEHRPCPFHDFKQTEFDRIHSRHCERSEAIHFAEQKKNGLLRRFAPRNDVAAIPSMTSRSRGAMRPSLDGVRPRKKRAQGMPGARRTPRSRTPNGEWVRARAYGLSGGIRHPLRNGFTAYAALSPATNSSCHRRRRLLRLPSPVGSGLATVDLAPATGVRTTRFCRTLKRRSSCAPAIAHEVQLALRHQWRADALASTTSHSAFVTTRDRPSCRNRTAEIRPLIWDLGEAGCCPSCQTAARRRASAWPSQLAQSDVAKRFDAKSPVSPAHLKGARGTRMSLTAA
jgi:hypothetical protein